jgi:probable addiction module antidote protein
MKPSKWDPAESIRDDAEARIYLEEAAKGGDASELAETIGWVAKAYGMRQLADEAGIPVEKLYETLGRVPEPKMSELLAILESLGVATTHSDAAE